MKKPILLAALCAAAAASASADPYLIAVIPKGTTDEFWKAMHVGALDAARELTAAGTPTSIIWKGTIREDDREGEVQVVENFIGRQVSGIALAPLDENALVGPVEEAVDAHIPVVILDSSINSKKISSYVATNNREGGRIAARYLGKLLDGKGNAILLRVLVGGASTEQREEGFLEVMRTEFPNIKLLSTDQHSGATRDTARAVSENLLNRFGSEVNGIFCPNETSATGMLLALRDAGLSQGKVKFVGFDTAENLVAGLASGDLQGLVVQNPYNMGYLGVKTVVSAIRGEKVPPVIDTGVTLVTNENRTDPKIDKLIHPPTNE